MRRFRPTLAALLGLALAGCLGPQLVYDEVYESPTVRVRLRRTVDAERVLPLGHEHPAQIAAVRLSHILAGISHADRRDVPRPTIRTEHVYDLAEGLAKGFQQAGPDDELVAVAESHDRRLGIFSDRRVTAFKAYLHDGQLHLDFFAIEYDWQDADRRSDVYVVPPQLPVTDPPFRLVAATGTATAGPRSLIVDWRDDYFRKPVNLSVRSGQVRRRTVLMESEATELVDPSALPAPEATTDAQLQALDQLDAARRAGLIPESEFQRRRRLILQGRLSEAGYEPEPPQADEGEPGP